MPGQVEHMGKIIMRKNMGLKESLRRSGCI